MAGEFDPAYLQWLMQPQAPTGPSLDKNTQKAQGAYLTQLSKGANATTDLDTLISANQLQPGAFDPMVTMDPVDAPGARTLATWRSSNSPYQQFIAAGFDAGKSANQILAELQKVVADPSDDFGRQIAAELPPMLPYWDDQKRNADGSQGGMVSPNINGMPVPDMRAVGDEIRGLETSVQGDPEHTFDPITGQPVAAKTEDSAAMKAWHDAGFVSDPTATYDPWSLAPAGAQEKAQGVEQAFGDAQAKQVAANTGRKSADQASRDAQATYKKWLEGNPAAGQNFSGGTRAPTPPDTRAPAARAVGAVTGALDDAPDVLGAAGGAVNAVGNAITWPFRDAEHQSGNFSINTEGAGNWLNDILPQGDRDTADWSGQPNVQHDPGMGRPDLVDYEALSRQAGGQAAPIPGRTAAANPWIQKAIGSMLMQPTAPRDTGGFGRMPSDARVGPNLSDVQSTAQMQEAVKKALFNAYAKSHDALAGQRKASDAARTASHAQAHELRAQAARQAYVNQLTAMGRTPARDEVNARNRMAYGLGL